MEIDRGSSEGAETDEETLLPRNLRPEPSLTIMLPIEFYVLNATTALIWLYQNCSHEALILLFGLGALALVAVVGITVYRLASEIIELFLLLLNVLCNHSLRMYTTQRRTRATSHLRSNSSRSLENLRSPETHESSIGLTGTSGRTRVPSVLALHPLQWDAVEARQSQSPRLAPQTIDALVPSPRPSRVSLRRSRRVRPRATDSA